MTVVPATLADVDWIIGRLAERRELLTPLAPVFWRPASDAAERHRAFVEYLLTEGGGLAYRTTDSALIATPRGDGWLVDDLHVRDQRWTTDGIELWNALATDRRGDDVRFVCPTYEVERAEFASEIGLTVAETWWLIELGSGGGEASVAVSLPGADAVTVGAPPVYAPPGPMLFLPSPADAATAVPPPWTKPLDWDAPVWSSTKPRAKSPWARFFALLVFDRIATTSLGPSRRSDCYGMCVRTSTARALVAADVRVMPSRSA